MFDLPQPILQQLLSTLNTNPQRLSASESEIAKRICRCSDCDQFWVRRKVKIPDRCPRCHSRTWDRPFLNALMASIPPTPKPTPTSSQIKPQEEPRT